MYDDLNQQCIVSICVVCLEVIVKTFLLLFQISSPKFLIENIVQL